jgi:hypothetical protein
MKHQIFFRLPIVIVTTLLTCSCTPNRVQIVDIPKLPPQVSKICVTMENHSPEVGKALDTLNARGIRLTPALTLVMSEGTFESQLKKGLIRNGFVIADPNSITADDLKAEVKCVQTQFNTWTLTNVQTGQQSESFGGITHISFEIKFVDASAKILGAIQVSNAESPGGIELEHMADQAADYIKKLVSERPSNL